MECSSRCGSAPLGVDFLRGLICHSCRCSASARAEDRKWGGRVPERSQLIKEAERPEVTAPEDEVHWPRVVGSPADLHSFLGLSFPTLDLSQFLSFLPQDRALICHCCPG